MSRYARKVVSTGANAWNAEVNDNHLHTFDRPLSIFKHAGNIASLESSFPAASYDQAIAICQFSSTAGDGLIYVVSNGAVWRPVNGWELFGRSPRTVISDTYAVLVTDEWIVISGSNTFNLTLPAITGANNQRTLLVKHKGTGVVTAVTTGGDTIDGEATFDKFDTQYKAYSFTSDGTSDWMVT